MQEDEGPSNCHERISHHVRYLIPVAIFREQLLDRRLGAGLIMFLNRAPRTRTAIACLTATINGVEDLSWGVLEGGVC